MSDWKSKEIEEKIGNILLLIALVLIPFFTIFYFKDAIHLIERQGLLLTVVQFTILSLLNAYCIYSFIELFISNFKGEIKMKQFLYDFIAWTWCLPQQLLGLLVKIFFLGSLEKPKYKSYYKVFEITPLLGVSLGQYIIIPKNYPVGIDKATSLLHETGHTMQSYILGPLYLLVVGIPSFIFNVISRFNKKFAQNYYKRFPESWADKLGGVKNRG
jgi:hypothetical protein